MCGNLEAWTERWSILSIVDGTFSFHWRKMQGTGFNIWGCDCADLVSRALYGRFLMASADVMRLLNDCIQQKQTTNWWFVLHKTTVSRLIISRADRLPHLTAIEFETRQVKIKKRLRLRRYFDVSSGFHNENTCSAFTLKKNGRLQNKVNLIPNYNL